MTIKHKTAGCVNGVTASKIPCVHNRNKPVRTGYRPSADYQRAYARLYGCTESKSRYRRDRLPEPLDYYRRHLHALRIGGDWASTRCPFHDDRNPSLSVNITHGGFICHACGASGRDVLAFHMQLNGMDFITAAKDLGTWEDSHD
jgi:hypothetical protein